MALTNTRKKTLLVACGLLASAAVLLAITPRLQASTGAQDGQKSRITIASGVRLRSSPATSAEEVTRLQIGAVLRELEQGSSKEKIGSAEDYWYRVATGDGKEGWLFGSFTIPFNANNPAESYRRIASERLKIEKLSFTDLTDLVKFLSAATGDVKDTTSMAELELARVTAFKRAVEAVPPDYAKQSIYDLWLKANEASVVYSDPAAVYFVRSELFWKLQKKYSALPIAERIAWDGANNPLPGECEGYVPCHLSYSNQTMGEYLRLYPRGAHAEEAMNSLVEDLKNYIDLIKDDKPQAEDKTEARKVLPPLRDALMKTASPKKTEALDLMGKLSAHYR